MLHYVLYQNKSKGNKAYGKWFARTVVNQTIDLDALAEHMSNHNTPYSKGAIYGVLTDMVNCIRELVLEGNAVKIPNLAIFSAGITTKGTVDPSEFKGNNIVSTHLRARSTGDFTRAELTKASKVSHLVARDVYIEDNGNGDTDQGSGDSSTEGGTTNP